MRFTQPGPTLYNAGQKEWTLGCVNPSSWLPLAAEREFTQPRVHSFAQPCSLLPPLLFSGSETRFVISKEGSCKRSSQISLYIQQGNKKERGRKENCNSKEGKEGNSWSPVKHCQEKKNCKDHTRLVLTFHHGARRRRK